MSTRFNLSRLARWRDLAVAPATRRRGRSLISAALVAALAAHLGTGSAAAAAGAAGAATVTALGAQPSTISIQVPVPQLPGALPVYRLAPLAAPAAFIREILPPAASGAPLALQAKGQYLFATDGQHLAAYADTASGEAQVFTDFSRLKAGASSPDRALAVAQNVFGRADVLPKDATTLRLSPPTVLWADGATRANGTVRAGSPASLLSYVPVQRYAANYPVFGKGSRAMVAVANDGSVQGFVRRWRSASVAGQLAPATSAAAVVQSIESQLKGYVNATTSAIVDRIGIGYYDGNQSFLQPVYYFTAIIHRLTPAGKAAPVDDHVIGYVPIAQPVEPLPVLSRPPSGPTPALRGTLAVAPRATGTNAGSAATVSVGEYIVRNDDADWNNNAVEFWNGMAAGNALANLLSIFGLGSPQPPVARTQYYWAYQFEYLTQANSYLNSVNIADTESHGDWWIFSTLQNCCDIVDVHNIGSGGTPGYGAASGGQLATWLIHSCEVIPAFYDLQQATGNGYNAFTPWWNVFSGLHNALGYR
jgi:hypothetical protein